MQIIKVRKALLNCKVMFVLNTHMKSFSISKNMKTLCKLKYALN